MTTSARAVCVIGWPIGHSRSPLIHSYWLKSYGIAGEYRREAVPPEQFASFVQSLAARGYVGANVTVPHKEAVLKLSRPDERALAVGAANTLWFDGDLRSTDLRSTELRSTNLRSTNTDVEGFLDNLDASAPAWHRDTRNAVVLGAGGAARAVVYGLLGRGVPRIVVVNRTAERAAALQQKFGERITATPWELRDAALTDAALLVNTTTLGMRGQPALDVDCGRLPGHAVVADLVYVPLMTTLLRAAKARGLRTADGVGMLLHQAVRGFALWFGKKPAVTPELRALIEADIGSSAAPPPGIT